MRYLVPVFLLLFCITGTVIAGGADVVAVDFIKTGEQTYRFDVTVRHTDSGWEHYANHWEIIDPDGTHLGTRVLAHPHVNEQPFTRSLSDVKIPLDVHQVTIRAHDSVHAFDGETLAVDLH